MTRSRLCIYLWKVIDCHNTHLEKDLNIMLLFSINELHTTFTVPVHMTACDKVCMGSGVYTYIYKETYNRDTPMPFIKGLNVTLTVSHSGLVNSVIAS